MRRFVYSCCKAYTAGLLPSFIRLRNNHCSVIVSRDTLPPELQMIDIAIAYSIKRWNKLMLYTSNGMLAIDNNPVENSLRPVALGRKNYLFAGSHEAAQRTAMIYSLLGSCKMQGINPYLWLKDVLKRISMHPINKIKELLPHNWKQLQVQDVDPK